jgi:hypothetical protein
MLKKIINVVKYSTFGDKLYYIFVIGALVFIIISGFQPLRTEIPVNALVYEKVIITNLRRGFIRVIEDPKNGNICYVTSDGGISCVKKS